MIIICEVTEKFIKKTVPKGPLRGAKYESENFIASYFSRIQASLNLC